MHFLRHLAAFPARVRATFRSTPLLNPSVHPPHPQVLIASLTGVHSASGATWPVVQALLIAFLQLFFCAYVAVCSLSVDVIDNCVTSLQFLLEGTCTVLLASALLPSVDTGRAQGGAFAVALVAMLMPVGVKVYDLGLKRLLKLCNGPKGGGDKKGKGGEVLTAVQVEIQGVSPHE